MPAVPLRPVAAVPALLRVAGLCFALAALALAPVATATEVQDVEEQEAEEQKAEAFEMTTYQLVLLVRPADAPELSEERLQEIQRAHLAHLTRMGEEGKAVLCGPFGDQQDAALRGACIYDVGSVEEARRLASGDPAVAAGRLEVEAVTWWVGKGYVAFPKRPVPTTPNPEPNRTPEPEPEQSSEPTPGSSPEAAPGPGSEPRS